MLEINRQNQLTNAVNKSYEKVDELLDLIQKKSSGLGLDFLNYEAEAEFEEKISSLNQDISEVQAKLESSYRDVCEIINETLEGEDRDYALDRAAVCREERNEKIASINDNLERARNAVTQFRELTHSNESEPGNSELADAVEHTADFYDLAKEAPVVEAAIQNDHEPIKDIIDFGEQVKSQNERSVELMQTAKSLNEWKAEIDKMPAGQDKQLEATEWAKAMNSYKESLEAGMTINKGLDMLKSAVKNSIEITRCGVETKIEQYKINKADKKRVHQILPSIKKAQIKSEIAFLKYSILRKFRDAKYSRADAVAHKDYISAAKTASKNDLYVKVLFFEIPIKSKESEQNFYENHPFDEWKKSNETYINDIKNIESKYSDKIQSQLDIVGENNVRESTLAKELNSIIERNPDIQDKFNEYTKADIERNIPKIDEPTFAFESSSNTHTGQDERAVVRNDKTSSRDDEER